MRPVPVNRYLHGSNRDDRRSMGAEDPPRVYTNQEYASVLPHEVPTPRSDRATSLPALGSQRGGVRVLEVLVPLSSHRSLVSPYFA